MNLVASCLKFRTYLLGLNLNLFYLIYFLRFHNIKNREITLLIFLDSFTYLKIKDTPILIYCYSDRFHPIR